MENINENLVPSFGAFMNGQKETAILESYEEINEAKFKKGASILTKKDLELPVYDMLRKEKSGSNNGGSKAIKKGMKIEIQAVLKSKDGDVLYKTNYGTFDANVIDELK